MSQLSFSASSKSSLQGIKEVLDVFYGISGLQVSYKKSEIFYIYVTNVEQQVLATLMSRVPLIFGKLKDRDRDYQPLIDKITSRT